MQFWKNKFECFFIVILFFRETLRKDGILRGLYAGTGKRVLFSFDEKVSLSRLQSLLILFIMSLYINL